jgi:hypothetical protein
MRISTAEVKNGEVIHPLPLTSSWHSASLIKDRNKFAFLDNIEVM